MSPSKLGEALAARVRVMQIVTMAIVMGAVVFLVIALFIRAGRIMKGPQENQPVGAMQDDRRVITYVGLVFSVCMIAIYAIVPDRVAASARRKIAREKTKVVSTQNGSPVSEGNAARLCDIFQTRLILRLALLEGPTFCLLVAYILEGQLVSLITAVLLMAGMLVHFPMQTGVLGWIDEQLRILDQELQESV